MPNDLTLSADELEGIRAKISGANLTPHAVAQALRDAGRPVSDAEVLTIYEQLKSSLYGHPLLDGLTGPDTQVSNIVVHGTESVLVTYDDRTVEAYPGLDDAAAVRRLAQRLAAQAGARLDDGAPYADVRLPNGTRMKAALAGKGLPTVIDLTLDERIALGILSPEAGDLYRSVERLVRDAV